MALKNTVHEICQQCGKMDAWQESGGTVHIFGHYCPEAPPGPFEYPRSFRPGEVIFVSRHEQLVDTIKTLQNKNKRLSSDFSEMAKDCAKLQKILFDIGLKVNEVLGREVCGMALDLVGRVSPQNSWQCDCDMWNAKYLDSCCNCGRSK